MNGFTAQGEPPAKKGRVNPQVYMDIKIGNKAAGRLRFLLRADIVPMTAGVYLWVSRRLQVRTFVFFQVLISSRVLLGALCREFPLLMHTRERLWLQG